MTESDAPTRHGRRARRLSPEEAATLEARTAAGGTGEQAAVPAVRGAVAPPTADTPVPTLRKFGRRARIIELTDLHEDGAGQDAADRSDATGPPEPSPEPASPPPATPSATTSTAAPASSTATIVRDSDGVELGEMSVTEAPDPRPAPRFEGKVLHRPESTGGKPLVWLVWALIAVALLVLIVLLVTGVLGSGVGGTAARSLEGLSLHNTGLHALTDLIPTELDIPTPVEEPSA